MSCCKGNGHSSGCVCEVVRAILDIQDSAQENNCDCQSNCFMEPLGAISPQNNKFKRRNADTRVLVLKNADGSPFHAFFKGYDHCVSIYFRVEDVFDNCCATLRVLRPLKPDHDGEGLTTANLVGEGSCCVDLGKVCEVEHFAATDDCVTVDLHCFCAVQCIEDVDLNIQ